ncbi:MAG: glycosyltransferase family 4 protein [Desulfovibrio sp.]|nr:glycosyltransferase family 4 protein [Desulfovibrio sp.]
MRAGTKRIFGSIHPFLENGPVLGRIVANEGFFRALLDIDPFDEYVFFLHAPDMLRSMLRDDTSQASRRGAITVASNQEIIPRLKEQTFHCFHLADPLCDQTSLAYVRNHISPELFPITSVPHTLSYHPYVKDFLLEIWPGVSPRDAICATSRAAVSVLKTYFSLLRERYALPDSWGEPSLRLLPLGVDTDRFAPGREHVRRAERRTLGIGDDTVLLFAHGRISVDDKMDLLPLLYAVHRVILEEDPPILHLLVSGKKREGDRYPDVLLAQARALGIPFSLVTDPDAERLCSLYAAADIFVSPSDNLQETFGLTILEAQASGLPVIASDWDGYRDLVINGETGFLIPTLAPLETPDLDIFGQIISENIHQLLRAEQTVVDVRSFSSAISLLARRPDARRRMGMEGRKRVQEQYSWTRCIQSWLKIVDDLWNISLSPEEEERFRHGEHPAFLPFTKLFAGHPAQLLDQGVRSRRVRLSARGGRVLAGKDVAVQWNALPLLMQGLDTRKLLTLLRKGGSIDYLLSRMRGDGNEENILFAVLWALKHDLLEFEDPLCSFNEYV